LDDIRQIAVAKDNIVTFLDAKSGHILKSAPMTQGSDRIVSLVPSPTGKMLAAQVNNGDILL
jgi:hypothetical protein